MLSLEECKTYCRRNNINLDLTFEGENISNPGCLVSGSSAKFNKYGSGNPTGTVNWWPVCIEGIHYFNLSFGLKNKKVKWLSRIKAHLLQKNTFLFCFEISSLADN